MKILGEISKKKASLEGLVTGIWGYQYDPLRHDGLVYSAMNQLKKSLQEVAFVIERQDQGYSFLERFSVVSLGKEEIQKSSDTLQESLSFDSEDLNFRQMQILSWFKKHAGEALSIQDVKNLLQVSTMTAHRDLKGLCQKQKIKAIGRARATVYIVS
jgi:predicted HTH transcriptional regulator